MLAVVLCSAQSKKPVGRDAWVGATVAAVDQLARDGYTILASVGLNTWELALWRAVRSHASVHVMLVPRAGRVDSPDEIADAFGIPRGTATWEAIEGRGKGAWQQRDARAVRQADLVVPVCLRNDGKLARLLRSEVPAHKVTEAFSVPFERHARGAAWERRRPTRPSPIDAGKLVHLTRSAHGPWPGEARWRYYEALARSRTRDPRDAFATLSRIVGEGRIRGTTFRSQGCSPRVCLTARAGDALDMVRFRARYARYSFEPYAIAIDEQAAVRCGARAVRYGAIGGDDARFMQGSGVAGHWEAEREWRIVGDLDLRCLAPSEVLVVTATDSEARELERTCSFPVSSFGYVAIDTERATRSS